MSSMSPARQSRVLGRAYQLHRGGRIGEALQLYRRVIESNPANPVALHQAALATRQLTDLAQSNGLPVDVGMARRFMEGAVAAAAGMFSPDDAQPVSQGMAKDCAAIIHNYAKFLNDYGDLTDRASVIPCYEAALSLDPTLGESWTNLGNAYGDTGNRMRAEAAWTRALECPTVTPEARFNLSMLHLLRGDYAKGWADYEARWESVTFRSSYGRSDLSGPRWDGSTVAGTLLLHGEQGAGDVLMMARYLPWAQERCTQLVVEVLRPLVPLFRVVFPGVHVVARGDEIPAHDAQLPMLSLPAVHGTTLSNVPQIPSFAVITDAMPVVSGQIGLCWKGSATHPNDRLRSMDKETMVGPLAQVPGITLQSLQHGDPRDDRMLECPNGTYFSTTRVIASCEAVVTVDTSIAHLAGSMGKPTLLCLPLNGEWRWLQDRADSPWYPSMTVIRQHAPGDWAGVIERVREDLCTRV